MKDWDPIEFRKDQNRYLDDYNREKKHEILMAIRISGIMGGISHKKLARAVRLDPKNLRHHIKILTKKGLVIKGKGLHGKYFPAEELYKDPILTANLLGRSLNRLLRSKKDIILTKKKELVFHKNDHPYFRKEKKGQKIKVDTEVREYDFTEYKNLYLPLFTGKTETEKNLFEFSNRIGGFVTRTLIEAMNKENYNDKITDLTEQQVMTQEYISKTMSTFVPSLIPAFIDLINNNVATLDPDKCLFDDKIIRRLEHAFSNVYPLLGYEFKEIVDNMSYTKESYERFTRELHNKMELRKKCEHEYKKPTMTSFGYGRQCSRCNYIQKVKEILVKKKKESN